MATHTGFLLGLVEYGKGAVAPPWIDAMVYNDTVSGWEVSPLLVATHLDGQPISAEPANNQVGVYAGGFSDDFYNRIIIDPGFIDVGSLVSDQTEPINIFNGYFTNKTLEDIVITNGTGLNITGISLPETFDPLETIEIDLSISTDGPSRIDASLFFDWTGAIDDSTVQVIGIRIVSFPYQSYKPNIETLEWKTDVLISNKGTEQRVRLRGAPRQFINQAYPVPAEEMAHAKNIMHGWLGNRWAVPAWQQSQIVGALSSGITVILCDGENYDLREEGLVQLWDSNTVNEIIEIQTVTPTQITLSRPTVNTYSNCHLLPAYAGRVLGDIQRPTTAYNAVIKVRYQILDNKRLVVPTPDQYLTYDIYFDELYSDTNGSITDNLSTRVDVVDFETGDVDFYAPWDNIRIARPYKLTSDGPEESWAMREFLHRRAGRLRPFWLPSFESDMRLEMSGLVSSTLIIHDDDYRSLGIGQNHIAIKLIADGGWHPREITGTSLGGGGLINVAIDTPLSVDASEIEFISFLGLKRFNADRIPINWVGNSVCTISVPTIEIKP